MAERIYGTAPDGTEVSTEADSSRRDEDMCPAEYGPEGTVQAWCTEAKGHAGRWHIASTGAEIVMIWANERGAVT
jgi:hypothetical protein